MMFVKFHMSAKTAAIYFSTFLLMSCADPYLVNTVPNYDHLVGKKFADVIQLGRIRFKKIDETDEVEILREERPDGCASIFGVRKKDDVITFWKITPAPYSCKVRGKPLNV